MYRSYGKRLFDLVVTGAALVALWPIFVVTALLVRLNLGSPVLFRQERVGLRGTIFRVQKFRSMIDRDDESGMPLPDEDRLTRFGAFLRSTSLDELPELLSVLQGTMSLVGPRPLHVRYLERYSATQARRHEVKPGITGLAQISGRNGLTWEQKFTLDVHYVDNYDLRLDVKILLLTVIKTLTREGISQPGSLTAEEFMGADVQE
ncbi:MAG: sugar transferase [Chloroflexota bacterium]